MSTPTNESAGLWVPPVDGYAANRPENIFLAVVTKADGPTMGEISRLAKAMGLTVELTVTRTTVQKATSSASGEVRPT